MAGLNSHAENEDYIKYLGETEDKIIIELHISMPKIWFDNNKHNMST